VSGLRGEAELVEACLEGARAAGADTSGLDGSGRLVLGPGDDAAILRAPPGHDLVWSSDEQVEDVHFRRVWGQAFGFAALGAKAAGASLSDLAAMGAEPLGVLFSLRLPPELAEHAEALARGVGAQLAAAGCPLAGGNLARAPQLGLTIDVLGTVPEGRGLRRDAAQPGDAIYVSGELGWSALGLRWLEAGLSPEDPQATRALEALFHPRPRLELGQRLLKLPRVACMDLSDGLAKDLPRLARASGVRAEVSSELLPGPSEPLLATLCEEESSGDASPASVAWSGGEDYELLVAGPARDLDEVSGLIRIGVVSAGEGVFLDGALVGGGHDHFPDATSSGEF
jgi:thiamine-monophosphate kinase